jgi:hypothetical protein
MLSSAKRQHDRHLYANNHNRLEMKKYVTSNEKFQIWLGLEIKLKFFALIAKMIYLCCSMIV